MEGHCVILIGTPCHCQSVVYRHLLVCIQPSQSCSTRDLITKSRDILLQPLLPIIFGKAAGDTTFHDTLRASQHAPITVRHRDITHIEKNGRRHMNAGQAVGLGQKLDIVCDLVPTVQASVCTRLVRDFEKAVDFLLVDADAASQL